MVRRTYAVYSRANALARRNQLITEQYQHIRESAEGTSLMRHEWKNQLTSLYVLARKGDPVALERALTRLDSQLAELSPGNYSDNIAVNVLLQNTAARCRHQEIKFTASAMVPADLPVEEADLCSLLLNLVDNALEAASQVEPEKRVVKISLNVNQGYLAVKCENAYKGPLSVDDKGGLLTTKQNRVGAAGMGLAQIRAVTEKYQGMFHFSYTPDWFTANASLRLP